ncbi:polysaccharide deacetylase family protein [Desmospora profundinema]|uniref:Peptidoglycan/xylan/chitin deacetylase (PgdA/CDA1 family) n=1 Tax=Desmospora profundinema TaxID=1571184 RepID=A0ABU1IND7_9BACL|nr:polysaccharide deacetylase family protein [Desmospora profundinema]MDR6226057.1 peptidoglycan/xylan/chitin deacetylase (PgdA/CDA1 family) [Desmospora profundinema]
MRWFAFILSVTLTGLASLSGCMPVPPTPSPESQVAPSPQPQQAKRTPTTPGEREIAQLPTLQGGAEYWVRKPRPVSNDILQKRYPNIFALAGPSHKNQVALTFDDGPDSKFTPQVLDVLKKHNVPATFFVVGARARALPEVTRRMENENHVIGNHTYWHPNLPKESMERMDWEVRETERAIRTITGKRTTLFRAPYGELAPERVERLGDMGYSVIGWSVDSLDWRQLPTEEIINNVLSNTHPGSIILFHSGGHWTQDLSTMVEALDRIIPRLKADGIRFVTVPELLRR